jgi:hypothetical protein
MKDANGRYVIPSAPGEARVELDCSCGYGWSGPERAWDWISDRHAHAHNKGIDGLAAAATWDVRHITAAEPEPEAEASL